MEMLDCILAEWRVVVHVYRRGCSWPCRWSRERSVGLEKESEWGDEKGAEVADQPLLAWEMG